MGRGGRGGGGGGGGIRVESSACIFSTDQIHDSPRGRMPRGRRLPFVLLSCCIPSSSEENRGA